MLILYFGTGINKFLLYSFSKFHVVPLHTLLMAIVAVVITKIHNVTRWCTLFNCLSGKQASQNVHCWDQNVWVSKCLCRCCLCVSKCLFKMKSNKRGKAAISRATLSAERTQHAIGKNYAIKATHKLTESKRYLVTSWGDSEIPKGHLSLLPPHQVKVKNAALRFSQSATSMIKNFMQN